MQVLKSIYGDDSITPWTPPAGADERQTSQAGGRTFRYQVALTLLAPHEDVHIDLLVSLPPDYPAVSPPQLQLMSRYIGPFKADSELFGRILRTFISVSGVDFTPGVVAVFDGVQHVLECLTEWYKERLSVDKAGELQREFEKERHPEYDVPPPEEEESRVGRVQAPALPLPDGIEIFEAEPILDRKSVFIGRTVHITHPSVVPIIIAHLLKDKKVARAAHPTIYAWRCQVDGRQQQDYDDDGETPAGARLAHLIQIMDLNNVLVVVTRIYGGIHLGPDRFKHINQAARDALELGGFLDEPGSKKHAGRGRKK